MRWIFAIFLTTVLAGAAEPTTVLQGSGYFPVMVRLKSGDLLAVVRAGGAHVDVRGRLDMIRSTDQGKTWSAPTTVIDEEFDDRNPALGQASDGTVVLAYAVAKNYDESGLKFKGTRKDRVFDGVYLMRSSDDGRTWSKPQRSSTIHDFYVGQGVVSPYGKIVTAKDGTLLMAVYFEFFDDRGFQSFLFRSRDQGRTWKDPVLMGAGYNETGLAVLSDGTVVAALRSGKGQHLAIAKSSDAGLTWSTPVQVTADFEHPGDLIPLRDGRLLLTYGVRNPPRGVDAMLSSDNGATWNKDRKTTLAADAPNVDCGYPSSVQLSNGDIATLFYQVDDPKNVPATSRARFVNWKAPKR